MRHESIGALARLRVWAIALVIVGTALFARPPRALADTWAGSNCNGASADMTIWKRSQAKFYAQQADHEGYEWGGGCYKLNDRDDTPSAPDSGGEGADCSGFVFKSWALRADGSPGYRYWDHQKEIHGPFTTGSYYSPSSSSPFKTINKGYAATSYMDAFVYNNSSGGHIAMIYSEGSGGFDYVVHAHCDACGTEISWEDYRSTSIFRGVMRKSWTPECYPHCS